VPPLPLGSFGFGLNPRPTVGDVPFLSWRDGLKLAAPAPHDPAALSRTLAAFGHAVSADLHIAPALAPSFGAACGYLLAGVPPGADCQESCDLAASALHPAARPGAALQSAAGAATDEPFWRHAQPVLAALADLFLGWTADPSGHAALRAAWRRGRSLEMNGG